METVATGDRGIVNTRGKSWMEKVAHCSPPDAEGWVGVRGLSQIEAQELLDWLEHQSVDTGELTFDPADGFAVRWRVSTTDKGSQATP